MIEPVRVTEIRFERYAGGDRRLVVWFDGGDYLVVVCEKDTGPYLVGGLPWTLKVNGVPVKDTEEYREMRGTALEIGDKFADWLRGGGIRS